MKNYIPFDEETADTTDHIAWILCQIIDDDAPLNWTKYRFAAICIATNSNLLKNLQELKREIENNK